MAGLPCVAISSIRLVPFKTTLFEVEYRGMRKALFLFVLLALSRTAFAEILVLENGKTMKVKSYSVEGARLQAVISDRSDMMIPLDWVKEIRPTPPEPVAENEALNTMAAANFAYSDIVLSMARKHQVDWRLIEAVLATESNYNPKAISPKGARGLMQLMPETAKLYRVKDLYDPRENIEAGVRHLKMLMERYEGKLEYVLAAYNSGEKAVDQYRGIPPYQETRSYVKKVLQRYQRSLS
jgi:soluble lytic murein transglycosylase-like protein